MQQMVFIEGHGLSGINSLLNNGCKVVSVTPIIKCVASLHDKSTYGAYVVIEKDDEI